MAYVLRTPHHVVEPRPSAVERLASRRLRTMDGAAYTAAIALGPRRRKALNATIRPAGSMDCVQQRLIVRERKGRLCAGRSDGWLDWPRHYDGVDPKAWLTDVLSRIAEHNFPMVPSWGDRHLAHPIPISFAIADAPIPPCSYQIFHPKLSV